MKTFRNSIALLAGIALLLTFGVRPAAAVIGGNPAGAPYVSNQTQVVLPASSAWYRFDYAGDHSQMTITLPLGAFENLSFEVYTPLEITAWWDTTPIGAGSANGDDLSWSGNSHVGGAYYIKVINNNPHAVGFQLKVEGSGVTYGLASVTAPVTAAFAAAPAANADPAQAPFLPAAAQGVPAKSSVWYRFSFDGRDDHEVKVTLPYGSFNNLAFKVYSPGAMSTWWDADAIGAGIGSGDDLVWFGDLFNAGTYYIKVINDNPYGVGFELKIQRFRH